MSNLLLNLSNEFLISGTVFFSPRMFIWFLFFLLFFSSKERKLKFIFHFLGKWWCMGVLHKNELQAQLGSPSSNQSFSISLHQEVVPEGTLLSNNICSICNGNLWALLLTEDISYCPCLFKPVPSLNNSSIFRIVNPLGWPEEPVFSAHPLVLVEIHNAED